MEGTESPIFERQPCFVNVRGETRGRLDACSNDSQIGPDEEEIEATEIAAQGPEWPGRICTASGVTAVTDPAFLLGETSIVNIGSEGGYKSTLRAGCHEAAVERGSRG